MSNSDHSPKTTSAYANVNGTTLYYETSGSGNPIVFIHGMGLDRRMWDEQVSEFSKTNYVLNYDLRGFGKSILPTEENYTHQDDLRELLNLLGIGKVTVVGLSMGGRIAIDFTLTHPNMVESLVVVDSVLHGYKFDPNMNTEVAAAAKEKGPKAANVAWLHHPLFKPARTNPSVAGQLQTIVEEYSGWHWVNKNPWIPLTPNSIERLSEINSPTLVVVGEHDLPDFLAVADVLEQNIAAAQRITMKGVGHMSNMEDPVSFNGILSNFLHSTRAIIS